jgi:hypothetical protein
MKKYFLLINLILTAFIYFLFCVSAQVYAAETITSLNCGKMYTFNEIALLPHMNSELIIEEQNGMLYIQDKESTFSMSIIRDYLDEMSSNKIKEYYGDSLSNEKDIFYKFLDLKISIFNSMKEYYRAGYLYGNDDKNGELAMKVFLEYEEKIFGQQSQIKLYNTLESVETEATENSHIDIIIPVPSKKTIYSINFIVNKGELNGKTLSNMSDLLCSIYISELPPQNKPLYIFTDLETAELANAGIYPESDSWDSFFTLLVNEKSGYKLRYPSSFVSYFENSIIDSYDYRSFKIDSNNYFSVAVRDIIDNEVNSIQLMDVAKGIYGDKISIVEKGKVELSDKKFSYFKYKLNTKEGLLYAQNYSTTYQDKIYVFELKSQYAVPSSQIKRKFLKILSSLEYIPGASSKALINTNLSRYISAEGKYYISYPESWSMLRSQSEKNDYDSFLLKSPQISGPLEIMISEGDIVSGDGNLQTIQYLAELNSDTLDSHIVNYNPPYQDLPGKFLSGYFYTKEGAYYFIKLVNFLDNSGRNRLCYSVDIIRNGKVFSLFITISEYASQGGSLNDKVLSAFVNLTADSLLSSNSSDYSNMLEKECEALFKQIFNTEVNVSLPSGEIFLNIIPSQEKEKKYYTLANAKFGNFSGYFGIEINPLNGDIKILSFHPKQIIIEEIKELYSSDTYNVLNYFISDTNPFEIMVFLVSKLDNTFKIVQVKLEYNSLLKNLNIIDLWSLKP